MQKKLTVRAEDVLQHLKLSCQMPDAIAAIVNRSMIEIAARKAGIEITPEELQQAADNIRAANNLSKADETWKWLQKHYLLLEDFEALAEWNLLSTKLAEHLFADKVEAFFYEHQLDYEVAAVYEVILEDEDSGLELFYALQENELSFQDIVRESIQDPELRRTGGYRGLRSRRELRPEIAAAVFAAKPPQILKPIVTPKGVHLIWVEEIISAQLDDALRLKLLGELFSDWLNQQAEDIEVVADLEIEPMLDSPSELPKPA